MFKRFPLSLINVGIVFVLHGAFAAMVLCISGVLGAPMAVPGLVAIGFLTALVPIGAVSLLEKSSSDRAARLLEAIKGDKLHVAGFLSWASTMLGGMVAMVVIMLSSLLVPWLIWLLVPVMMLMTVATLLLATLTTATMWAIRD